MTDPKEDDLMIQNLTQRLRGLDSKEVKRMGASIAAMAAKGFKIDDAFPQGIVNPDAVIVNGHLPIDRLTAIGEILKAAGPLRETRIFPRGIPVIDTVRVKMTIGRNT